MKKCFLEKLPHKSGFGKNKDKLSVDWKSSLGCIIPFQYKDVSGELKILDYNSKRQMLKIEYNGKYHDISTIQIHNCSLGSVIGEFKKCFIYEIGQVLDKNGLGVIIARFRQGKNNIRHYRVKCLACDNKYTRSEYHLSDRGVKCPKCGDGISYPNKFVYSLLSQIGCGFESEFVFDNEKGKRYDFYISDTNSIIEVHGIQHYEDTGFGGRTLKEEQKNDRVKEKIAIKNGITNYIEIDARKAELLWIKDSILKSNLNKLYDLSKVDWEQCHEFAVNSLIYDVCLKFEDGDSSITKKIADEFGISRTTVVKYLKMGNDFGWCNYDPDKIQSLNSTQKNKLKAKSIICLETGEEFESASECSRVSIDVFGVKLIQSKITSVCNGLSKSHKGYTFKYINSNDVNYDKFLKNEIAKDICKLKNDNPNISTTEIAKKYNLHKSTVSNYLKIGTIIGLCKYDPSEEAKRINTKREYKNSKAVEVFKDGKSLGSYKSTGYLSKISLEEFGVNLLQTSISNVCRGKRKTHKGYVFKYIN